MQEGVLVVSAEPFAQAVEAPSCGGHGGARYGPHFVEVEGQEPGLGTVDALFDFHAGVLKEHLGVGCDIAPFWDGLKPHIEHSRTMYERFDIAFSPLHPWIFAEREQRRRIGWVIPYIVELTTDNVVGQPSYLTNMSIEVVWIHCNAFKKLEHRLMQSLPYERAGIIHDGKIIPCRYVPGCRKNASLCARPRNVDLVPNASRRSSRESSGDI